MKRKSIWCKTPSREERIKRLRKTLEGLEAVQGYDFIIEKYKKELIELEDS